MPETAVAPTLLELYPCPEAIAGHLVGKGMQTTETRWFASVCGLSAANVAAGHKRACQNIGNKRIVPKKDDASLDQLKLILRSDVELLSDNRSTNKSRAVGFFARALAVLVAPFRSRLLVARMKAGTATFPLDAANERLAIFLSRSSGDKKRQELYGTAGKAVTLKELAQILVGASWPLETITEFLTGPIVNNEAGQPVLDGLTLFKLNTISNWLFVSHFLYGVLEMEMEEAFVNLPFELVDNTRQPKKPAEKPQGAVPANPEKEAEEREI